MLQRSQIDLLNLGTFGQSSQNQLPEVCSFLNSLFVCNTEILRVTSMACWSGWMRWEVQYIRRHWNESHSLRAWKHGTEVVWPCCNHIKQGFNMKTMALRKIKPTTLNWAIMQQFSFYTDKGNYYQSNDITAWIMTNKLCTYYKLYLNQIRVSRAEFKNWLSTEAVISSSCP